MKDFLIKLKRRIIPEYKEVEMWDPPNVFERARYAILGGLVKKHVHPYLAEIDEMPVLTGDQVQELRDYKERVTSRTKIVKVRVF